MTLNKPLHVFVEMLPKVQTIAEVSENIIKFLRILAVKEPIFSAFEIISEKKNIIGVPDVFSEDAVTLLSNGILMRNLKDIKKFDKIEAPDINFSRDYGFIFSLGFNKEKAKSTCWSFVVSGEKKWQVTTLSIEKGYLPKFSFYKNIVDAFIESFDVKELIMKLNDRSYREAAALHYKFALGWINYFSKDYPVAIPDSLPHVQFEKLSNGTLFYLSESDFDNGENGSEAHIQKLNDVMAALMQFSPNYGI